MNAEDIKNKAAETMSNAKEKVEAVASDKRVQSAKASILKSISDAKCWIVSNWNVPGWRGKAKVAAAFIVAFFFCRGVFCGWGASQLEKALIAQKEQQLKSEAVHKKALRESKHDKELREAEAAAQLLGLLGDGGFQNESSSSSRLAGPQKKLWICQQCGNQVHSVLQPPRTLCSMYNGHGERDGSSTKYCRWRVHY